ncbi:MAG: amidohydrolase [Candidatus Thorarchaeota archaeon]
MPFFADLCLTNGHIVTVAQANPSAEAIAVKDDRIQAVGSNDEIVKLVGDETRIIDLQQRTVIPGLIDSHMHPGMYGIAKTGIDCDTPSMSELLKRVKERASETASGEWVLGFRLDDVKLGRYPTLEELDRASPDNPLYIERRDAHIGIVNSLALEAAMIDENTSDPPHGKIDRDAEGQPTGVLRESAKDLVYEKTPEPTLEEYKEGLELVMEEFLTLGITTIHASMTTAKEFRAFQELRREGRLRLRVCIHMSGDTKGMLEALIDAGIQTPFGDDWLKITEIEWIFDTSTSGRTAAYYEPYVGEPDNTGILLYDQDDITERVRKAHDAGLRVGLDGIGDRGIDRALDAIEAALQENPREDHRHRIEHCCYATPAILSRLENLGVIDASATGFIHDLGDAYQANRGKSAMQWMWPHRILIEMGIPAPGHSDCPICSPNPWLGIYGIVTRKTDSGQVLHAEQAISPLEGIEAYTKLGAYAGWEEGKKGTIEKGKLADLVVLDRNPLEIPRENLKNVKTLLTVLGGKITYNALNY